MKKLLGLVALGIAATAAYWPQTAATAEFGPAPQPTIRKATASAQIATGSSWAEGWEFRRRTVCVESTIPGAPLRALQTLYANGRAVRLAITARAGYCAKAGYPASQRVVVRPYTAADKRDPYIGDACAYAEPWLVGQYIHSAQVRVQLTGTQRTACGGGVEWLDVWAHELGHLFGLSHEQGNRASIMQDGHTLARTDRLRLHSLYGNNPW